MIFKPVVLLIEINNLNRYFTSNLNYSINSELHIWVRIQVHHIANIKVCHWKPPFFSMAAFASHRYTWKSLLTYTSSRFGGFSFTIPLFSIGEKSIRAFGTFWLRYPKYQYEHKQILCHRIEQGFLLCRENGRQRQTTLSFNHGNLLYLQLRLTVLVS